METADRRTRKPKDLDSHRENNRTLAQWFDRLNAEFRFTLDPACTKHTARCSRYFTPKDNGLAQPWTGERVWLLPPYNRLEQWLAKAVRESGRNGATVVALVPRLNDRPWWKHTEHAVEIRLPDERVIGENGNPWTFPIAIIVFAPTESP